MRSENSELMKRKAMWMRGKIGRGGICAARGISFGTKWVSLRECSMESL
jgi:hypothetical protein